MATRITLQELHSWILEAREILYDEKHEGVTSPKNLVLTGELADSFVDVLEVQESFCKVLEAVDNLDCLFHDKFDCR